MSILIRKDLFKSRMNRTSYMKQCHKCGYANCPICKTAVTNSGYQHHIKSHPGHENDNPPPPRMSNTRENRFSRQRA